jgi:DNA-binding response OmpR family regulator
MNTRKKILIADDDPINVEFFAVMLSKLGFDVEKTGDGAAALEAVKRFYPDLILLDNIMPVMTGWELTRALKSDPDYQDIPIIMLSGIDDVKTKVEGFELGIDDYITKPFNFSEVLARIRAVLRNRELLGQIMVRESRLGQAEDLVADMKAAVGSFVASMDNLEAAIADAGDTRIDKNSLSRLLGIISEKLSETRKRVSELDARIERTFVEWESLKKDEIGIKVLETRIHHSLGNEQSPGGEA